MRQILSNIRKRLFPTKEERYIASLANYSESTVLRLSDLYPYERWGLDNGYLTSTKCGGWLWIQPTQKETI